MLARFERVQPSHPPTAREVAEMGARLERAINPIAAKPIVDGRLIEDVALEPFEDNVINHGLGRELLGYWVVRRQHVRSYFEVGLSGDQVVTTGAVGETIEFADEAIDDGDNFNTTTFRYVAPVKGLYKFNLSGEASLADGQRFVIDLFVNGAIVAGNFAVGNGTNSCIQSVAPIIRLEADDYVTGYVEHDGAGDMDLLDGVVTYMRGGLIDEGVQDRQAANTTPERTLILRASYAHTVSLWVF